MLDHVDLGCGRRGHKGIGVDLIRGKADVVADVTLPVFKPNSFRVAHFSHVLEHLPDLGAVESAIREAALIATDTLYIKGPWFDADDYLRDLGLNLFWSSWVSHPTHLTSADLGGILTRLGLNFTIGGQGPMILDSMNPRVHPIGYFAPHNYTRGNYPPKQQVQFDIPIYDELVCEVELNA
jgi:hypothetical protein